MAKYEIFECDICNRQIEIEERPQRPTITKCVITNRCLGTLKKIGEKSTRTELFPASVQGLDNWVPRGTTANINEKIETKTLSILSGENHLALATPESTLTEINLKLKIKNSSNLEYKEFYFYRDSSATIINGQDDSVNKSTLLFSPSDSIKVFHNGIELQEIYYDKISIPNSIRLNFVLTEESNVFKIFVYKPEEANFVTLKFKKDHCDYNSAWGNVDQIKRINSTGSEETFDIFICDDISALNIESYFIIDSFIESISSGYILFANEPFSSYDRILHSQLNIFDAINKYEFHFTKNKFNIKQINIDENLIDSVFPLLTITKKCGLSKQDTTSLGSSNENKIYNNKNVIGPNL